MIDYNKNNFTNQELMNISDSDIRYLRKNNPDALIKITNVVMSRSRTRKNRSREAIIKAGLPLPPAYSDFGQKPLLTRDGDRKWKNQGKRQYENWGDNPFNKVKAGESMSQVVNKLKEGITFLSTKTSTKEGWERVIKATMERITQKTGVFIPSNQYYEFWKIVNAATQLVGGTNYRYTTDKKQGATISLQQLVWSEMEADRFTGEFDDSISVDSDEYASRLLARIRERITEEYEKNNERNYTSKRIKLTRRGL